MTFQFFTHFIWKKCDLAKILTWFPFHSQWGFLCDTRQVGIFLSCISVFISYWEMILFFCWFWTAWFWTCLSCLWEMYADRDLLFLYLVLAFRSLRQNFGISVLFCMCLFCGWISVLHLLDTFILSPVCFSLNVKEIILHWYNQYIPFILKLLMIFLMGPANMPVVIYPYQSSYMYCKTFSQS